MSNLSAPGTANYLEYLDSRAHISVPGARVRLVALDVKDTVDSHFSQNEGYWLDMCLTPRPDHARGCFEGSGTAHRYEHFGNVFMLPPGEVLRVRSDRGHQVTLVCVLEQAYLERWFGGDILWNEKRLDASVNLQAPVVQHLLRRLGEEIYRPGFGSEILCEALVVQLAVELGRYYAAIDDQSETGGLPVWRLRVIDERIRDQDAPPTLAELAGLCGLSVRQLTRGFRASRGCSLGEHIAAARIDNAKRLLRAGKSVKTTAFSLGFGSPSSFCSAFRRATGLSPREHLLYTAPARRAAN